MTRERQIRLKEAIKAAGTTLEKLSEATGISVSYLSRLGSGDRPVKVEQLRKIAAALEMPPERLVIGSDMSETHSVHKSNLTRGADLAVMGEVRAGAWLEFSHEKTSTETIPMHRDPRFDRAGQYALRIIGNSINKKAENGDYALVAEWASLEMEIKDGLLVVVEWQRGPTVETTIKRVRQGRKGWELWPESTDPTHQDKIALQDGEKDVEVRITGLVTGFWRQEPLP